MRITDQYVWNFLFTLLFLGFVIGGGYVLQSRHLIPDAISFLEFFILSLATLRLSRLFINDKITAFFREQFYDVVIHGDGPSLTKPARGPRRTLADLLSCPWCFGVWAGATVVFFYYLTPYAWYPILFLAVSGAGTILQLAASALGWRAEHLKQKVESKG